MLNQLILLPLKLRRLDLLRMLLRDRVDDTQIVRLLDYFDVSLRVGPSSPDSFAYLGDDRYSGFKGKVSRSFSAVEQLDFIWTSDGVLDKVKIRITEVDHRFAMQLKLHDELGVEITGRLNTQRFPLSGLIIVTFFKTLLYGIEPLDEGFRVFGKRSGVYEMAIHPVESEIGWGTIWISELDSA